MALSISYAYTVLDRMDTLNWTGDPSIALNTEIPKEGTGCIAVKVETTRVRIWSPTFASPIDVSNNTAGPYRPHIMMWMNVLNYQDLAGTSQGAMQICVEDSLGNWSCWHVGGSPSSSWMPYFGGWKLMGVATNASVNDSSATPADLTDIVKIGASFLCATTTSLTHNVLIDYAFLDNPNTASNGGFIHVTGINTTDGNAWEELYNLSEANNLGFLEKAYGSVYYLRAPIIIGDVNNTVPTRFVDYGNTVFCAITSRMDSQYPMIALRSTDAVNARTDFQIGQEIAVGSGSIGVNGLALSGTGSARMLLDTDIAASGVFPRLFGALAAYMSPVGAADYRNANGVYKDSLFEPDAGIRFGGATVHDCTIYNCTRTDVGSVRWDAAYDGNVKNLKFLNNEVAVSFDVAGTYTFDGHVFSGNTIDIMNRSTGTVVINAINGSNPDPAKVSNTNGGTVIINNSVNVQVHCYRVSYGATATASPVDGVTILLAADAGGPLPYRAAVPITNDGAGTATVTHNAHGFSTGDYVIIRDADQPEYTGLKQITVVDANTYTYSITGTPASPATGSPNATAVVLYGVTDVNGDVIGTLNYTSDQPVTGTARKTSAAPLYKIAPISGTVTVNGFRADIAMIPDDS